MKIYCCGCGEKVEASLVDGRAVYPHRDDLFDLPFWQCDICRNFVGTHHKTNNPLRPLGVIATPEIKRARQKLHQVIDPLWQSGRIKRKELYKKISSHVGWKYHTANIRSIEEARDIYRYVNNLKTE